MKIATSASKTISNLSNTSHFGIQAEDMSHVLGILRSRIYSDKILAVIREYLTNALDAMKEAGKENHPIDFTLPSLEQPTLTIRDYGHGLTGNEIRELYIMYGASTKRHSNDYTGCLGIGCKAAFAYTDSFTITSWNNNLKSTWVASIDDSNQGKINLLNETASTEANGIEIQVPIQTTDINSFISKAKDLLPYISAPISCNEDHEQLQVTQTGTNWKLLALPDDANRGGWRTYEGQPTALMGHIPYKIDADKMNLNDSKDYLVNGVLNTKYLIIDFPLGSLDIAANRESLEYTKRTIDNILLETSRISTDFAQQIEDTLQLEDTLWNASLHALTALEALPSNLRTTVRDQIHYKGETLLTNITSPLNITCYGRKHRWRKDDYTNTKDEVTKFTIDANCFICSYDADEIAPSNATRRIRTIQADKGWHAEHKFYLIPVTSNKIKHTPGTTILTTLNGLPQKFLKKLPKPVKRDLSDGNYTTKAHNTHIEWQSNLHLIADSIISLNDIEPLKANRTVITKTNTDGSTSTTTKPVRISLCQLSPAHLATERLSPVEDPIPFDNEIIYIPLDRYRWHKPNLEYRDPCFSLDNTEFNQYQNTITELIKHTMPHITEGTSNPIIHGVKKHFLPKLSNEWITLDAWYERQFKVFKNKYRKAYKTACIAYGAPYSTWPSCSDIRDALCPLSSYNKDIALLVDLFDFDNCKHYLRPGYQYRTNSPFNEVNPNVIHEIVSVAGLFKILNSTYTDETTYKLSLARLNKRYPLLPHINRDYSTNQKEFNRDIKRYIHTS